MHSANDSSILRSVYKLTSCIQKSQKLGLEVKKVVQHLKSKRNVYRSNQQKLSILSLIKVLKKLRVSNPKETKYLSVTLSI